MELLIYDTNCKVAQDYLKYLGRSYRFCNKIKYEKEHDVKTREEAIDLSMKIALIYRGLGHELMLYYISIYSNIARVNSITYYTPYPHYCNKHWVTVGGYGKAQYHIESRESEFDKIRSFCMLNNYSVDFFRFIMKHAFTKGSILEYLSEELNLINNMHTRWHENESFELDTF